MLAIPDDQKLPKVVLGLIQSQVTAAQDHFITLDDAAQRAFIDNLRAKAKALTDENPALRDLLDPHFNKLDADLTYKAARDIPMGALIGAVEGAAIGVLYGGAGGAATGAAIGGVYGALLAYLK